MAFDWPIHSVWLESPHVADFLFLRQRCSPKKVISALLSLMKMSSNYTFLNELFSLHCHLLISIHSLASRAHSEQQFSCFWLIISYLDSRTSPVILRLGSHLAVCPAVLHGFQPHELFCLPRTANCCYEGLSPRQWWKLQATATGLHGKWLCWRRLISAVLVQVGWEENHDSAFLCHDLKSAWIILGGGKKDPEG